MIMKVSSTAAARFLMMASVCWVMAGAPERGVAEDNLPSAEQLLDKYVEVTGGKAAYQKLTSQVRIGKMEIPTMGQTIKLAIYNVPPQRMAQVAESEMMGKTQMGCDGEHVWIESPMMGGAQLMDGERAEQILAAAAFNPEINWRDRYEKVETVGSETIDGKPCYKVVRTPKQGEIETLYINKDTHLIEMTQTKAQSPMGEVDIEILYSEYKKSGDITSAHKTVQKMAGMEQVITFDEVKYNVEVDPNLFTPPDAIKEQIQKQKESADKNAADKADRDDADGAKTDTKGDDSANKKDNDE